MRIDLLHRWRNMILRLRRARCMARSLIALINLPVSATHGNPVTGQCASSEVYLSEEYLAVVRKTQLVVPMRQLVLPMRYDNQLRTGPTHPVSGRSIRSDSVPPSSVVSLLSNMPLKRTINSSFQLAFVAAWRHTSGAGSGPVSAVAGR